MLMVLRPTLSHLARTPGILKTIFQLVGHIELIIIDFFLEKKFVFYSLL